MRVDVERGRDLLVPEPLLYHLGVLAVCQRQRRVGVAHAVDLDRPYPCRLDQLGELPLSDVVQVERLAQGVVLPAQDKPSGVSPGLVNLAGSVRFWTGLTSLTVAVLLSAD